MPTDNLADVIARVRKIISRYHTDDNVISVDRPDLYALLDAAEAGMRAADRIAALEAALRWIKEMPLPAPTLDDPAHFMKTIAVRALEEKD